MLNTISSAPITPQLRFHYSGPHGGVWAPMKSATTKIAQCILENLVDSNKLDSIALNEEGIIDGEVEIQTGFDASGKDNFSIKNNIKLSIQNCSMGFSS